MTTELTRAWASTIGELRTDRSVRVVVVTGAGSSFSAGGDLDWIEAGAGADVDELRARMLPFYRSWLSIRELEIPTIAAINGPAVGAGLALALACDLRYATAEATMSTPFTALGIHAGMATTWSLPEVAGLPVAREMLLTGRVVAAAEAVSLGLVNQIFDTEPFLDEVLQMAAQIAGNAPLATRFTKVALAGGGHATFEDALQWEALAQAVTMGSADHLEGLAAVRERRRPRFRDL
jgi:enoyl-CoA hydratase